MNKQERNIFFQQNGESIERIVDFTIRNSQQYKKLADAYIGYKNNSKQSYSVIANINLNYDDVKQQLFFELLEVMEKITFVNLEYLKLLCKSRLKNILRRYYLEMATHAQGVVFEKLDLECFLSSSDMVFSEIVVRNVINDTLLLLDDPLEKKYLLLLVGNLGIAGYEEYSFLNPNKAESDDLCMAKLLGFESIFQRKYRKLKKTVNETLYSVIKSYDDVA